MPTYPHLPRRKPIRLRGYNYAQPGAYFVTIVTHRRRTLFGNVIAGEMRLNTAGDMVRRRWEDLSVRFPNIDLDEFVVMPNHIHGIILIREPVGASLVGARDGDDTTVFDTTKATTRVAPTLGEVVGAYKSIVTLEYARGVRANVWLPFHRRLWQRNYYERVIRDDAELDRARKYIVNNPLQWELDRENPDAIANRRRPRRP